MRARNFFLLRVHALGRMHAQTRAADRHARAGRDRRFHHWNAHFLATLAVGMARREAGGIVARAGRGGGGGTALQPYNSLTFAGPSLSPPTPPTHTHNTATDTFHPPPNHQNSTTMRLSAFALFAAAAIAGAQAADVRFFVWERMREKRSCWSAAFQKKRNTTLSFWLCTHVPQTLQPPPPPPYTHTHTVRGRRGRQAGRLLVQVRRLEVELLGLEDEEGGGRDDRDLG